MRIKLFTISNLKGVEAILHLRFPSPPNLLIYSQLNTKEMRTAKLVELFNASKYKLSPR